MYTESNTQKLEELADQIARAIRRRAYEMDTPSKGTPFKDGGCIVVQYFGSTPPFDNGQYKSYSYRYTIMDGEGFTVNDENGLPIDCSIVAAMKIRSALQANRLGDMSLLSGINPEVAAYPANKRYVPYLGGLLAKIRNGASTGIIAWAVSGDTARMDLYCGAAGIEVLKTFPGITVINAPTRVDIEDAMLAYDIAKACKDINCCSPLILGEKRFMNLAESSTLMLALRARKINPVLTEPNHYEPTIQKISDFVKYETNRNPNDFFDICSYATNALLETAQGQPKDCIIVVRCSDLMSVLTPYLRGLNIPICSIS